MILLQTDSSWIADLGIGLIILGIILLLIWIWAIADIARRADLSMLMKVIWVVIVIAFPFVGVILYVVFGRSTTTSGRNPTSNRR